MDAIKELFKEWGLPAAGLPAFAWLWSAGLVHWMPLLLALLLGFWVYALQKPLPIFPKQAESLKSITEGKNLSAQSLKRRVQRVAASMQAAQTALAGANSAAPRWQQSLLKTEAFFSQHLGSTLFTFKGFNALLLVALIYPLIFLLLAWVFTGEGRMGNAQVLPDLHMDFLGPVKRLGLAFGLVFLVAFLWFAPAIARRLMPHLYQAYAEQSSLRYVYIRPMVAAYVPVLLVITSGFTEAFAFAGNFAVAYAGLLSILFSVVFGFSSVYIVAAIVSGSVAGSAVFLYTAVVSDVFKIVLPDILAAPLAVLFSVSSLVVFSSSLAIAILLASEGIERSLERNSNSKIQLFCVSLLCLILTGVLTASAYFVPQWSRNTKLLQADKSAFMLLLFFGILPLFNAIFDWLSVGFTRGCLRCMLARRAWAWGLVVLDAVMAVLLTFGLFALVLWILLGLQAAGWGVDGRGMLSRFAANPLDSQSSWIAMLALTNLLPTFWHLILSLWGWMGRYARPSADAAALVIALDQSLDAQGRPMPGATGHLLGDSDRHTVYQTLYVEPWLVPLSIIGLVIAFWTQYVQSLGWLMRLVLASA